MDREKFESLIDTNYKPNDEEVRQIQTFLSDPLQRMQALQDDITLVEAQLERLRQERDEITQGIDKYCKMISLVRRLPEDIFREIFISCLPNDRNPTMSCDEAPVLLTRICSSWRDLAIRTPRLWTSLHIPVPKSGPVFDASYDLVTGERLRINAVLDARLSGILEWIARSGTHLPLNFSIYECDVYPPTPYGKTILRRISEYRQRWRSISLICAASTITEFRTIQPSEVPHLQSLSLRLWRVDSPASGTTLPWSESPIFSAPGIRSVSLCALHCELHTFPLRWDQLTHFSIEGERWSTTADTTLDDITSILEACPNLVFCDLRLGHGCNSQQRNIFPLIYLPSLETLGLYDAVQVPGFVAAIQAPVLRKLTYLADGRPRAPPRTSALYSLLSGVGKTLEELTITPGPLETDDIAHLLPLCPSLKSLVIASSHLVPPTSHTDNKAATISSSFFNVLDIVPNLEKFECQTEAYFSDQALLDFILHKQSNDDERLKPLKSVYVVFKRRQTIDIALLLQPEISVGLSLNLRYPPRTYRGPFSPYEGLPPLGKNESHIYLQAPY